MTHTILRVQPDFFKLWPLQFIAGSAQTALTDLDTVAISRRSAMKFFGTTAAVGQTLPTFRDGGWHDLKVGAVFEDLPKNSHQGFGMVGLMSENDIPAAYRGHWGALSGSIYLRFRPGTDVAAFERGLVAWQQRVVPKEDVGGRLLLQNDGSTFHLAARPDIHLGAAQVGADRPGNDAGTIATFATVAVLILAMACMNFTNLATARASLRAREVALRKVLGARRGQLIVQFLVEALLVATLAMLLALALVELALPWFAKFLDTDLSMHYFGSDGVLLIVVPLTLLVALASGAYPAFYLTRFQPAQVLRTNRAGSEGAGTGRLRGLLVIGQFAISIGLIICAAVIYSQTQHARTADIGFRSEGLLQVEALSRRQVVPVARSFTEQVRHLDGVVDAGRTTIGLSTNNRSMTTVLLPGVQAGIQIGPYAVEPAFFRTIGLRLLAGRFLTESAADDATLPDNENPDREAALDALNRRGVNVVATRSAIAKLGFRSPAEAIGKTVRMSYGTSDASMAPTTIVGVVADPRFLSAHQAVDPMFFFRDDSQYSYLEVRFSSNDPAAVRQRVEKLWKQLLPNAPFTADFVDHRAADLYEADAARGQMFAGFALLSVIVGCLGLFGLASFTAERRTKEIGIRKVLGARTWDIVKLLVWQFSRPVVIANVIAWPVAWWVMRDWLNGFDDRIALSPLPFLIAGGMALLIAVVTVAGHAVRVASANPIDALRYE